MFPCKYSHKNMSTEAVNGPKCAAGQRSAAASNPSPGRWRDNIRCRWAACEHSPLTSTGWWHTEFSGFWKYFLDVYAFRDTKAKESTFSQRFRSYLKMSGPLLIKPYNQTSTLVSAVLAYLQENHNTKCIILGWFHSPGWIGAMNGGSGRRGVVC